MLYRVIWEIDIEARTPKQAANRARIIQLDPNNRANVFSVTKHSPVNEKEVIADLHPRKEHES